MMHAPAHRSQLNAFTVEAAMKKQRTGPERAVLWLSKSRAA